MATQCKNKLDALVQTFFKNKTTCCYTIEDVDCAKEFLRSCFKLHEEMRVWPPSIETLIPELALVYNQLVVYVATCQNFISCLIPQKAESLAYFSLQRVLQFAIREDRVTGLTCPTDANIVEILQKVVETVKDPVKHFRLMPVLSYILLVNCLLCVHKKRQEDEHFLAQMLANVDQLKKKCDESIQQQLAHKHSLLVFPSEGNQDQDYLYVSDVVRLVLSSCRCPATEGWLHNKQWQWLDTALQSQELIKKGEYSLAMKKLEVQLEEALDPEQKSKLLCLFAQCYLHQSCAQLAILTYRTALQTDQRHTSVLFHLAKVYRLLSFEDLELESLNLLVKIQTDQQARSDVQQWSTDLDIILMSVCDIIPNVTLLSALYHFAKRCFQLQRYQESAEQYQNLLRRLESIGTYNSTKKEQNLDTDILELIVETVESLSSAHRNAECIDLCDEFMPIFLTDDNFANISHSSAQMSPTNLGTGNPAFNMDSSQSSLFSQPETSIVGDELEHRQTNNKLSPNHLFTDTILSDPEVSERFNTIQSKQSGKFQNVCSLSRKRLRSNTTDLVENSDHDVWQTKTLTVRLLLSKADALVATQGYGDDTMSCLNKAYSILSDSKASIFKQQLKKRELVTQPPLKKRKCLGGSPKSKTATVKSDGHLEQSLKQSVSTLWAKSMISVALRIAQAALKRRQFPFVLNACQLILQIEPENFCAHYLTTLVSRDKGQHKDKVCKHWLAVRGIDIKSPRNILTSVLEDKEREIRERRTEKDTGNKVWWKISDIHLLNLDVACMNDVLQ